MRNPARSAELAILYTLPQVSGAVAVWRSGIDGRGDSPASMAEIRRRVVRRAWAIANRDGAITGTSLYVCMPPAMASMYYHQVRLVLQIAATFDRDPTDPLRAAEFLVIAGRYPTVEAAVTALVAAPDLHPSRNSSETTSPLQLLRQVPSLVGLRLQSHGKPTAKSVVVGALKVASMVLPFIGIPIWAAISARSTRRLAQGAIDFYRHTPMGDAPASAIALAPKTSNRARWVRGAFVVAIAVGAGFAARAVPEFVPYGSWYFTILAEVIVTVTFGRLLWITRPGPAPKPAMGWTDAR